MSSAQIPLQGTARDPALRGRNIRLGLIVGGIAFLIMLIFMLRFLMAGLPQDRATYEQMEQRRSAEAAAGNEDAVHD